jgi:hypothetical protein
MIDTFFEHLTSTQRKKVQKLIEAYPSFQTNGELTVRKVDLASALGIRPDHVVRDLDLMSKRFSYRLKYESLVEDSRGKLHATYGMDERNIRKGGRAKNCNKDSGFVGKSRWLKIYLESR